MAFYCRKPAKSGETHGVLSTLSQTCANPDSNKRKLCGGWKYFMASCPKNNMMCSGMSGAWVAASTICGQRLY